MQVGEEGVRFGAADIFYLWCVMTVRASSTPTGRWTGTEAPACGNERQ
jgi:hypothetical protein